MIFVIDVLPFVSAKKQLVPNQAMRMGGTGSGRRRWNRMVSDGLSDVSLLLDFIAH